MLVKYKKKGQEKEDQIEDNCNGKKIVQTPREDAERH